MNRKRKLSWSSEPQQDIEIKSDVDIEHDINEYSKRFKQLFNDTNHEHHDDLYSSEQFISAISKKPQKSLRNILETRSPISIENTLNLKSLFNDDIFEKTESLELSSESSSESSSSSFSSETSYSSSPNELVDCFEMNLNLVGVNHNRNCTKAIKSSQTSFKAFHFSLLNFEYNLESNLSLLKKETLFFLIERNQSKNILSPFDQFASARMKKMCSYQSKSSKHNYNYNSVQKIQRLLRKFGNNSLNSNYLEKHNLLSNCVSQFFMPFFFDIFKASELHSFSRDSIEIILLLRRAHKTEIYLKYESLIAYFAENLIWNCLILYKYTFNNDFLSRMGYLNFYLSFIAILIHLNYVISFSQNEILLASYSRKLEDLSVFLDLFLDALILNGLFKYSNYVQFKRFFLHKQFPLSELQKSLFKADNPLDKSRFYTENICFEQAYLNISLSNLRSKSIKIFPLKLKNLCRAKIKECLNKNYDSLTIEQLNVPKPVKSFLLFDQEIQDLHKFVNTRIKAK